MIDLIFPDERQAFAGPLLQMYHDRKRVFIDEMGWQLKSPGCWLEVDDYDNQHAVYLMARDPDTGDHRGSVRLLPTAVHHMMEGVFPTLCTDGLIQDQATWEISRLVTSTNGQAGTRVVRVHRMLALGLVEFALLNDIESYVLVAETQRVPALLSVGWHVTPLSLPTAFDGQMIEALRIHIDPETLVRMRARLGYDGSILALHTPDIARAA